MVPQGSKTLHPAAVENLRSLIKAFQTARTLALAGGNKTKSNCGGVAVEHRIDDNLVESEILVGL